MIDLHTHLLAGIDDGARTLDEALVLARAMVAYGVTAAAVTPHLSDAWQTRPDVIGPAIEGLAAALAEAGVRLELISGAEIAYDWLDRLELDELAHLSYGGRGKWILVEPPFAGWPLGLAARVSDLRRCGIRCVIAHPERNRDVQATPELLEPLVAAGAVCQLTAPSLIGEMGERPRAAAWRLLDLGLAHLVASDVHRPGWRDTGMREALDLVGDQALARWLSVEVPGAIVAGHEPPSRPSRP